MFVNNQQDEYVLYASSRLKMMVGKVIWNNAKKMKEFKKGDSKNEYFRIK